MKKMLGILALAALVGGFVLIPGLSKKKAPKGADTVAGLNVGDTAPDFKLKNVDDRMVSLANIKDGNGQAPKGYIVTFTCNTCPYAVMYEDRIIELHQKLAPKGWPVVAIQPNDPDQKPGDGFDEMKIRAREKSFPFVYLFDDGQQVYPQYGATRTPHVFLLDNTRKVRYIGAIDNNAQDAEAATRHYIEEAVAAIESGKDPDPATTKAVGCGIKAK